METINENPIEQTIEKKEKRNYTKFDSSVSKLMKVATEKGFKIKDIAIKFECSSATAKKLLTNPMAATGYDRKKFAEILNMNTQQINDLIDLG